MNRGIYCAVGVATGVFLLGGGTAATAAPVHEADRASDPEATSVLPADFHPQAGEQHRLAASISTLEDRAGKNAPGHRRDELHRVPESLRPNSITQTPADRAELLDGLGGAKVGGVDLLGTLLNQLTGDGLLGGLTGEGGGPLGALLGGGPLAALTGAKTAPANGSGAANGTATVNSPAPRAQTLPANSGTQTRWLTDAAARQGNVVGEAPVASTSSEGLQERQPEAGDMLLGPDGPLGQVEILGGDTLSGLPVAGDLLAGGISLGTIDNLPTLSEIVDQVSGQASGQEAGKGLPTLGSLPTLGGLSRMLLGGESADAPTEAARPVTEHRILTPRPIDKAKVTPQLQELSGIVHQLPLAG